MEASLKVAVIGDGPAGLAVARDLSLEGASVHMIGTEAALEAPSALRNLGIAISGFRLMNHLKDDEERIVRAVRQFRRNGRTELEQSTSARVMHNSKNPQYDYGLMGFRKEEDIKLFKELVKKEGLPPSEFAEVDIKEASNYLGANLAFPHRTYFKSDEIPFSQYQYLNSIVEKYIQKGPIKFKKVDSIHDVVIQRDEKSPTRCRIWIGTDPLEYFDRIVVVAGRFVQRVIDSLDLKSEVNPVIYQLYSAAFPDDPTFAGSVFYDQTSLFSIVRQQPVKTKAQAKLVTNLGSSYERIDATDYKRLCCYRVEDAEFNAQLAKIKKHYQYPCSDNMVDMRRCFIVDFQIKDQPDRTSMVHGPYIFSDHSLYPGVYIASCFRATLSEYMGKTITQRIFEDDIRPWVRAAHRPASSPEIYYQTNPKALSETIPPSIGVSSEDTPNIITMIEEK